MSKENEKGKEDNPDYAGPEGNRLRAQAQAHAEQRHAFLDASKKAFESGDKAKAKELSDKGKEAGQKMKESNKLAAEVILKYRNDGYGDNYLDLHGLYMEEALSAFRDRMKLLQSSKEEIEFEVIPGAGHHSKNKAVIKPKIIEELTNNKDVLFEERNAGSIRVFINRGAGTASGDMSTRPPVPPEDNTKNATSSVAGVRTKQKAVEMETEEISPKSCCIIM